MRTMACTTAAAATPASPRAFAPSRVGRARAPLARAARAGLSLSLIHISEPTRPY